MNLTLTDTNAPSVLSVTLPSDGTTSTAVTDRFSVGFSEDLAPTTVNSPASYDLRSAGVDGVCFSPDGQCLATASRDQTARTWDAHTGQPLLILTGHTAGVNAVAGGSFA